MELSESLEDYLEAIFHLAAKRGVARARDIAERLDVNRSSVTGALQALAKKGLVNYEPYEVITLTRKGAEIATGVVRRHEALRGFLVKVLSVDEAEADEAACRLEHAISPPILERLVEFVEFVEVCPRGGANWIKGFGYRCGLGDQANCRRCVSACLEEVEKMEPGKAKGSAHPGRKRAKSEPKKRRGTGKNPKGAARAAPRNGVQPGSLVARRRGADELSRRRQLHSMGVPPVCGPPRQSPVGVARGRRR